MGFVSNLLNDTIQGTTSVTLLVAGSFALAFVAGMFYGEAFKGQNTFWWPVYILVFILVLKIIHDLTGKK